VVFQRVIKKTHLPASNFRYKKNRNAGSKDCFESKFKKMTTSGSIFQVNKEIPWEDAGAGIQRQVFGYDHNIMLVKVKFEKNAIGAMHEHHHTQVSYVESGAFELTIDGEKKILKQGDGYFVPTHIVHGCKCIEAGVLIDVFTPLREDFLDQKK
jgi:quercetin dioxygenase-like cupin family protein